MVFPGEIDAAVRERQDRYHHEACAASRVRLLARARPGAPRLVRYLAGRVSPGVVPGSPATRVT
jgi:hypothetical protein